MAQRACFGILLAPLARLDPNEAAAGGQKKKLSRFRQIAT
jgi:hypothetical protein